MTGCPRDVFQRVAQAILDSSGAERTVSFAYAVAWTQHTYGPQIIGCCALLQLLLGNYGRPGAGIIDAAIDDRSVQPPSPPGIQADAGRLYGR